MNKVKVEPCPITLKESRKEVKVFKDEYEKLKDGNKNLKTVNDHLRLQIRTLEDPNFSKDARIKCLQDNVSILSDVERKQLETIDTLQRTNKRVILHNRGFKESIKNLKAEIRTLRETNTALKEKYDELETAEKITAETLVEVVSERDKLKIATASWRGLLSVEKMDKLKQEIIRLKEELKGRKNAHEMDVESLGAKLRDIREIVQK